MKKFAFAVAAVATILFVAGCSTDQGPMIQPINSSAHKTVHNTTYHSKLGAMSTKNDTKK